MSGSPNKMLPGESQHGNIPSIIQMHSVFSDQLGHFLSCRTENWQHLSSPAHQSEC